MLHNQTTNLLRRLPITLFLLAFSVVGYAQDALTYQTPPKALADLVTMPPTPTVSLSGKGDRMVIMEQAGAPGIAELAQPELKLAGLRMNPANNGPSRMRYVTGLKIKALMDKDAKAITGLPDAPLISYVRWSPDETKIAFANSTDELWRRLNPNKPAQSEKKDVLLKPFYPTPGKEIRYYQTNAVNAAIAAILDGKKRALLTLATGTGKTTVAFQVIYKLWNNRWNRRSDNRRPKVLFLADRDILVSDPHSKEFAVFGDVRCLIPDEGPITSREVYFST